MSYRAHPSTSCPIARIAVLALLALGSSTCGGRAGLHPVTLTEGPPTDAVVPLKAHLHSGDLLVLEGYSVAGDTVLAGYGARYDIGRTLLREGEHQIALDSVALFETSVTQADDGRRGLAIAAVGLVTLTAMSVVASCNDDPKACFGSCPTFYVESHGYQKPVAEGFSASVARFLEARDVDALPGVTVRPGIFDVTMRNEALETHAVRSVRLLAVPKRIQSGVVATTGGDFAEVADRIAAESCRAAEGDCLTLVRGRGDNLQRRSWTDHADLGVREYVELEFPRTEGPLAVLLSARHTFVSTFLFYQGLAYLGEDAPSVFAAAERGDERLRNAIERPIGELGGLHVEVADPGGTWVRVGTFSEAGPLAADAQAIVLPEHLTGGPLRVRLDLVQGYWRIDQVQLVRLGEPVHPIVLSPAAVRGDGDDANEVLRRLLDPSLHLATYPGDQYTLTFEIPPTAPEYEVFLESEGFYYEWIRQEWMGEKDLAAAMLFGEQPQAMFRRLAPAFKEREATMEEAFWKSRVAGRIR